MEVMQWRKAKRSDGANTCVEVAQTLGALRDSKNPTGPTIRGSVLALVEQVKADRIR